MRRVVEVARTVVVRSQFLPRKVFRVFCELIAMYRNMVEQLVIHAIENDVRSFVKLKASRYSYLRELYPSLPSHYAYTACQDASIRVKSFHKLKRMGRTDRRYPSVNKISVWLDDHLWRMDGLTSIRIATHRGWIRVELEPNKLYWKYVNRGWRIASEAKLKLDRKTRRIEIILVFKKDVEVYKPRGYISVDVNENSIAVLVDGIVYIFETGLKDITLGYYYRRKSVQEKYDKIYGPGSRIEKRVMGKLRERGKKRDIRFKIANIVVGIAREKQYAIIMENLGKEPAKRMLNRIKDPQLRHRIYQSSLKGTQKTIALEAEENGVPTLYGNPRGTSSECPIHRAKIVYGNGSRIGVCSVGGEKWHREVVGTLNLLLRVVGGDGSAALSLRPQPVDGSPMPLGSTATHEPTWIARETWVRWKSLEAILNYPLGTNGRLPSCTRSLELVSVF